MNVNDAMDAKAAALRLLKWAQDRNFEGIDPYDALQSPFAPLLSMGTRYGRIFLTQFFRRSPVNFRALLGIKPGANPKAFALFLESVVRLARQENDADRQCELYDLARSLVRRLLALRSQNASGSAWGYNFPWQNRFQLLPPFTPTIVNTSFAGHALLDYFEATQDEIAIDAARSSANFILRDLNRFADGDDLCFSYTPLDSNFVHNANLLGASLLARLGRLEKKEALEETALRAYRYSLKRQRPDGSWFYAERERQRWIDSFHTGFNLEAIRRALNLGLLKEYAHAYRRGVEFYAKEFFLPDFTPKYYADRLYLVDVHAPAEAICFFSDEPSYDALARNVLQWTMKNMYDKKRGTFYFRKSHITTIKTPYMRWSQAWAFRALVAFVTSRSHAPR